MDIDRQMNKKNVIQRTKSITKYYKYPLQESNRKPQNKSHENSKQINFIITKITQVSFVTEVDF